MNNSNLPLSKNKKDNNISFVSFDDKEKNKENNKKNNATKKNLLNIFLILLVISLFVISGYYNMWYLGNNYKYTYNVVNKFNCRYASISKNKRVLLLRQVGFDKVEVKKKPLDNMYYDTVIAYRTNGDMIDSSTIYFNKNNKVKQVDIKLNYKISDYSDDKYKTDLNSILNNFISYSVELKDIDKLYKNRKLNKNINDISIKANTLEINGYYVIYMTIK